MSLSGPMIIHLRSLGFISPSIHLNNSRLNFSLFLKDPFFQIISRIFLSLSSKKVSEYDQEIQQLDTANQPTAPIGRATEH